MNLLFPYLVFNGNCREAMLHYQSCLGGELEFQTVGDYGPSSEMTDRMRNCILHASLRIGKLIIHGSDIIGETGLIKGNGMAIVIDCSSREEWMRLAKNLAREGEVSIDPEEAFQGNYFNSITDKFGNSWILNFNKTMKK